MRTKAIIKRIVVVFTLTGTYFWGKWAWPYVAWLFVKVLDPLVQRAGLLKLDVADPVGPWVGACLVTAAVILALIFLPRAFKRLWD